MVGVEGLGVKRIVDFRLSIEKPEIFIATTLRKGGILKPQRSLRTDPEDAENIRFLVALLLGMTMW
jgi:hypothetical protein